MRVKILKNVKNAGLKFHILRVAVSWKDYSKDPINKEAVDRVDAIPIYHRWVHIREHRFDSDTGEEYFEDISIDDNEISEIGLIAGVI